MKTDSRAAWVAALIFTPASAAAVPSLALQFQHPACSFRFVSLAAKRPVSSP